MAFDGEIRTAVETSPYRKLEALISVIETLSPQGYDQNMPEKGMTRTTNLCAQGHAMRLGMVNSPDHSESAKVFNLPFMTAQRLFGNTGEINKILGRPLRRRIHPKDWAKAARKVLAERKIIDCVA